MRPEDLAAEAAMRAETARRNAARAARAARLRGDPAAALAVRLEWEPITLFEKEIRDGRRDPEEQGRQIVN